MVKSEGFIGIISQFNEICKRVDNGSLELNDVRRTFQMIIEKRVISDLQPGMYTYPWGVSPDEQIDKVAAFLAIYGDGQQGYRREDIPPFPAYPSLRTESEVPLLVVMLPDKGDEKGLQRTFDAWWNFIVVPGSISKWRNGDVNSDATNLRLAHGLTYEPGIRWAIFDTGAYMEKAPKDVLKQSLVRGTSLAHVEVLMAMAQLPGWIATWADDMDFTPILTGCQLNSEFESESWSHVPVLRYRKDIGLLEIESRDAESTHMGCSPTVREF